MKSIYKVLLILLFMLMGACTNGDSDTGNQNAPKPPVDDPDKIKYAENLLEFRNVSLKQYLVQSKDNQPHGENSFDIFLNQGSAKGLEPEKYLNVSFDVNMTVELDNKDVTNTILYNSVCKLIYSGDHSCKIIFKPIKDVGVYRLKFSYKGININKQILLYVATRSALFVDNTKDDVHVVGVNYQVDLQLKSNLSNEDLIVPLTNKGAICITKIGDINASDQGTECIQYPQCEYQPQIGDLPRSCLIHYTLLKGGDNHPSIEVNQNNNYLRRLEIPSNYEPFTCLKDGLEIIKSKSDKTPINSIFLYINKQEKKEFTAFYCSSDNTSQALGKLSLGVNEIEPNNIVGKDAFKFFSGDQGESVFPIDSAINIHNGEYKTIQVQYNQGNIKDLQYFGSARASFTVTNERGKELGNSSIILENPDRITFLRVGTEEAEIDKSDVSADIKSISVRSHDQYNYREIFMKPDNLQYQGNSTLIMNTCFIEPSGVLEPEYDKNDTKCLISYKYLDANNVKQTVTLDDANITVGYYPSDRLGADLIKLPRGDIPSVKEEADLLKLKNGQHFVLHIDATEVSPALNAKIYVTFYEENKTTHEKTSFMTGNLTVDLLAQSYLVTPDNKTLLSFFGPKAPDKDKLDNRYMDKFYIRVTQSTDAEFQSHKIRFAILDKSASNITIKGYHMVVQEKYDENNRPITMADNTANECVLAEKGVSAGKYCECTLPETGGEIIDDAKACNFEIVSSGQSDGDYVNIGLVDQKNRPIALNQKIKIQYKYEGEDIKIRVRNTDLFGVSDDKNKIKNSVYFPMDKITQVKKDDSNQWNENIFKPDAFFNSSMNMFVDNNNMIHIINFPGKTNIIENNSGNNIPEFYLRTNNACFSHNGTACSNKDDIADDMVCTIPSGAITFSNNDVVQDDARVIAGTVRQKGKFPISVNQCSYSQNKYKVNSPKHLPVLQSLKEGDVAGCDDNSYLYNYIKDIKNNTCVSHDLNGYCDEYDDLYTMITAKHRLNIHCQLSSPKHGAVSDVYDFALSQRTNIATDDNNPRNANSGICFGVKQQFLDDGNKDGNSDLICDGLGLK